MKRLWIAGVAAALVTAGAAGAQTGGQPYRLSAEEFRQNLSKSNEPTVQSRIPTGQSGANVNTIRRNASGQVEVHETKNDVFVAHDGHAVVMIGDSVTGNHSTGPGEWLGGTMQGGKPYEMRPGDVLWIPAGRPHQVIVKPGESFSYLAVKAPNPPGTK